MNLIESLEAGDGTPQAGAQEYGAFNLRKLLPSELMQRPALRWPAHVEHVTGLPTPTLRKLRADGDHPRLYAIGRALFTTPDDLREWIMRHELDTGARLRPAGPGRPRSERRSA